MTSPEPDATVLQQVSASTSASTNENSDNSAEQNQKQDVDVVSDGKKGESEDENENDVKIMSKNVCMPGTLTSSSEAALYGRDECAANANKHASDADLQAIWTTN